ncbi:MAG: T9SS type A sorting domain-containing protein [Dysgonamonadaceae bacterium]|jgi:N-acetylmuramoyl-L-alanine amidase|nr:T9SS type A sorting domain-containing protein [Dysgonamonadaceae bacterium]
MKKIALLLLVLLTSVVAQATDLTGVKIYINPGHGGYDSDDRSIWTIPVPEQWTNPEGYWESKSNLVKGLVLKTMLEAAGATVIISRTENRTVDDRALSAIAAEANANNVDHFLSIHSNAMDTPGITNYLLLLYHGYSNQPTVTASLPMAQSAGPIQQNNPLTVWQDATPRLYGDFTFYGNTVGLGVLRPLTVPGFLSEGSFHDYAPETHRLCNNDYCKLEAMRMFQHFHQYFQRDMPAEATIAGWVKSENERVDVLNQPKFLFRSATDDQWKPLNGAVVTLLDESGQNVLQTYTTDNWYNGIFAFYHLAAGNYKVRVEATGYESKTVDVTASASNIAYAKVKLFNPDYALNSKLEPDYPQPDQDAGVVALDHYDFVQQGEIAALDALSGASIKRILFRNNKYYVLTTDPKIRIYDAASQTWLGELNLTGVEGGDVLLSDIAFAADGKLLACNKATIPFEAPSNYFKIYKWDNDNAAPTLLFQSQKQGNWTTGIVGETFATAGASDHLKVYTPAVTSGSSKQIRIIAFEYLAATNMLGDKYMGSGDHGNAAIYTEAEWGAHPKFTISPSGSGDHLIIDSEIIQATEYQFDWEQPDRYPLVKKGVLAATETPVVAQGNAFARYADQVFMAAPVCNADASGVGVALYKVTDGLDNAVKLSENYPESGLGATPSDAMLAGIVVNGYDIELNIFAQNQGTARYKTEQSTVANIYASELSFSDAAGGSFKFTLNENAQSVVISISEEGETLTSYDAGALTKGVHTISNPFGTTGFDAWSVTATARLVSRPVKISGSESQIQFNNLRGVTVDNNPESPFFGRIYLSEGQGGAATGRTTNDGVYVLDAGLNDITGQGATAYAGNVSWHTTAASPFRLTVDPHGQVYVTDWSDTSTSGIWVMNPADPGTAFRPVFGGTTNTIGLATANGTAVHGSVSDCKVIGTGDNMKLYTLDEDLLAPGKSPDPTYIAGGNLFQYNIGNSTTPWITAPSSVVYDDVDNGNLQKNGNSQIATDGRGGWWISQYRAANGDASTPCLIHVSQNGSVDYNSAATITDSYQGGMAVNSDGSILASGGNNAVRIFAITFNASNVPSLELLYTIEHGGGYTWSCAFDVAGNLYVAVNKTLTIYAIPKADNSYTSRVSVDKGTGIDAPEVRDNVNVYPNPVTSELVIDGQGTPLKAYTLYDLNGRAVRSETINGNRQLVSAGGLNAGVYILQIQTSNGMIVKRIIKK